MFLQKRWKRSMFICGSVLLSYLFIQNANLNSYLEIDSVKAQTSDISSVSSDIILPESNWSVVPYIDRNPLVNNVEDIVFPNGLYVDPVRRSNDWDGTEKTLVDAVQRWEIYVFYGNGGYEKIVMSNLDENNIRLREILGVLDDSDFYRMVINASHFDARFVLLGRHTEFLSDDVMTSFKLNTSIPDDVMSQLKANYVRSKDAQDKLSKINPNYKEELSELLDTIESDYSRIKSIYEGETNSHYKPEFIIDTDAFSSGLTQDELDEINSDLMKLPHELRRLLLTVHFVGDANNDHMKGYLGLAGHSKKIWLNTEYDNLNLTLWHEMGHVLDSYSFVYNNGELVNSFSRSQEFRDLWSNHEFVNDYYRNSNVEAFAETFGRWIQIQFFDDKLDIMNGYGGSDFYDYHRNLILSLYPNLDLPDRKIVNESTLENVVADKVLEPVTKETIVEEVVTEIETVSEPVVKETVGKDVEIETVLEPVTKETVVEEVVTEIVSESFTKETVVEEAVTETVLEPVTKETVVEEVVTETVLEPVTKETIVEEVVTETVLEPVTKETIVEEVVTETVLEPVTKETIVEEVVIETVLEPVTKETIVEEVVTETVLEPVTKEIVGEEGVTETVLEPVTKETIVEHVVTETVLEPVTKETIVEHVVTETVLEPVTKETIVDEVVTETVLEPVIKETIVENVVIETVLEPTVTETAVEPIVIATVVEPIITESVVEPIVTEAIVEPIVTEAIVEPIVTEAIVEPIVTEAIVEPIVVETAVEPVSENIDSNMQNNLTSLSDSKSVGESDEFNLRSRFDNMNWLSKEVFAIGFGIFVVLGLSILGIIEKSKHILKR